MSIFIWFMNGIKTFIEEKWMENIIIWYLEKNKEGMFQLLEEVEEEKILMTTYFSLVTGNEEHSVTKLSKDFQMILQIVKNMKMLN